MGNWGIFNLSEKKSIKKEKLDISSGKATAKKGSSKFELPFLFWGSSLYLKYQFPLDCNRFRIVTYHFVFICSHIFITDCILAYHL